MSADLGFREVGRRRRPGGRGPGDWVNAAGYRIERRYPRGSGVRGGSWMYNAYAPDGRFLGMSSAMTVATGFAMADYLGVPA